MPILELPKETLKRKGADSGYAYKLEDKPWERAPKASSIWPAGEQRAEYCPAELDVLRLQISGEIDSIEPERGIVDFSSGGCGYRDHKGNIHWTWGTGETYAPRLYLVPYDQRFEPYLRVGAVYWETQVNDAGKTYYQWYVGARRGRDATLTYFEVEQGDGLFGAQGSNMGPDYRKPTKKREKKPKRGAGSDDWGETEWENVEPLGLDNPDQNWGKEFHDPYRRSMGGDFVLISVDHTLKLADPGQLKQALQNAEEIFQIPIQPGQNYPKVIGVWKPWCL